MVDSNLLDANIDEILCPGEADADFKLENIDADAILGDDEHALDDGHKEKARQSKDVADSKDESSQKVKKASEIFDEQEQLDYDEEEPEAEKKQPRESKFVSERVAQPKPNDADTFRGRAPRSHFNDGYKRRENFNRNNDDNRSKFYINPNFKGSHQPSNTGKPYMNPGIKPLMEVRPLLNQSIPTALQNSLLSQLLPNGPPRPNFPNRPLIQPNQNVAGQSSGFSANPNINYNPPVIRPLLQPQQQLNQSLATAVSEALLASVVASALGAVKTKSEQKYQPTVQQPQPVQPLPQRSSSIGLLQQPPPIVSSAPMMSVPPPAIQPHFLSGPPPSTSMAVHPPVLTSSNTYPPMPMQPTGMIPNVTSDAVNWSLMVEAFVKKTNTESGRPRRTSSRSSSYSSRSRSYSSSSVSRSSYSHSSPSRYSSKSRSRSRSAHSSPAAENRDEPPYRTRSRNNRFHGGGRRKDEPRGRGRRGGYRMEHGRGNGGRAKKENKEEDRAHIMECAEAIGLDEEYLKKIEEQKRLREEFARKRSEKRQEKLGKPFVKGPSPVRSHFDQKTGPRRGGEEHEDHRNRNRNKNREPSPRSNNNNNSRGGASSSFRRENEDRNTKPSAGTETAQSSSTDSSAVGKVKAYLAVVVSNVKELENSYKRVNLLANSVGATKKVWQTSENTISIIFNKHEHAKQFMLQYHGKNVNGCRLDVSLEKVFLNLAAMP